MINRRENKKRIDTCNICLEITELTWEHVPPKCCENTGQVIINDIFPQPKFRKLDSQNGIKYRTICKRCNNDMGSGSDLELKKLFDSVKNYLEHETDLNSTRIVSINLKLVLKSVFGKLLAMDQVAEMDLISRDMRNFIMKDEKSTRIRVYFRLYPYNLSVQARTIVCGGVIDSIGINDYNNPYLINGTLSILNFFPLSFTISSISDPNNTAFVNLLDYLDMKNPIINLEYGFRSAFNPYTKRPLLHDWLIGVGNDRHPFVLANEKSPIRVSWKK
ncbi:MAG: hypothetical protein RBR50_03170 [Candidatus Izemoplasmatales bacterium]|nr:hypothetical protein [Candidatus Izemoplasmatales bacterium]